jgi:hypothetical protein
MGCFAKTKKFFMRKIVPLIGDVLFNYAVASLSEIEQMATEDPLWWSSTAKRKTAEAMIRTKARELGQELPTKIINLTIESALVALEHPESPVGTELMTAEDVNAAIAEGDAA